MKEERRMILQMIEEGKITAEEGVALLEALERSDDPATHKEQSKSETYTHHYAKKDDFDFEEIKREIGAKAERIRREFTSQGKTVTSRFSELVEKLISKVKDLDIDFDFPIANGIRAEKVFSGTTPTSGLIELVTVNGSIDIESWDKSEYRIEVKGWIRAESETEAKAILNEITHFEEDEDRLSVQINRRRGAKVSLKVYLPEKLEAELNVITSNGSIEVEELSLKDAKIETSNGSIHFEDCKGENLFCVTSNGKISMEDSVIDELYAKSSNGALRVDGIVRKAKCRTSNGSIRYSLTEATEGYLDLKTTNGSIEVRLPSSGLQVKGEINTTFGRLDCTLPHVEFTSASKEIANRSLRFRSTQEGGKPYDLICKTSNGPIRIYTLED